MCGHYYIDESIEKEIGLTLADDPIHGYLFATGDRHPTNLAPVITRNGDAFAVSGMRFGFVTNSGLILNARCETVETKALFRSAITSNRCIIPARAYYEWVSTDPYASGSKKKEKVRFQNENSSPLYFAGIYRIEDEAAHFVIITTNANDSIRSLHDRMPLLLQESKLASYLEQGLAYRSLLSSRPESVYPEQNYEQLRLFP